MLVNPTHNHLPPKRGFVIEFIDGAIRAELFPGTDAQALGALMDVLPRLNDQLAAIASPHVAVDGSATPTSSAQVAAPARPPSEAPPLTRNVSNSSWLWGVVASPGLTLAMQPPQEGATTPFQGKMRRRSQPYSYLEEDCDLYWMRM